MNEGKVKLKIECNVVSFYVLFLCVQAYLKQKLFMALDKLKWLLFAPPIKCSSPKVCLIFEDSPTFLNLIIVSRHKKPSLTCLGIGKLIHEDTYFVQCCS